PTGRPRAKLRRPSVFIRRGAGRGMSNCPENATCLRSGDFSRPRLRRTAKAVTTKVFIGPGAAGAACNICPENGTWRLETTATVAKPTFVG
ncbi:MAG: hypothetical protein N2439_02945, partial [Anaerolineae bacterium]|nr:hypothetical protein [Anaerolineae bacterium]